MLRVVALSALSILILGLIACPQRSANAPIESVQEKFVRLPVGSRNQLIASWYLTRNTDYSPRIEYLADLVDSLATHGVLVEPIPGHEYRLGFHGDEYADWIRSKWENQTLWMQPDTLVLDSSPQNFFSYCGVNDDSLAIEILENKEFIETLTGRPSEVFAFPMHDHDDRVLNFLRDHGFVAGRNGTPGYEPWDSFLLLDSPYGDYDHSWDCLSIYEMTLSMTTSAVMSVDPDSMENWLWGADRLPRWTDDRRWIHFYTHTDDPAVTGSPVLDAVHLAALLDALENSGEVWIAPIGEIAAYARETHHPMAEDDRLWEADWQDPRPWNGHPCAFSFSTDDGFLANLYSFLPVFAEREMSFTAFVNKKKIVDSDNHETYYMDSSELFALSEAGVEIGNHTVTHKPLLSREACQMTSMRGPQLSVVIRREEGRTLLELIEHSLVQVPPDTPSDSPPGTSP
jgi:hypothetical protein